MSTSLKLSLALIAVVLGGLALANLRSAPDEPADGDGAVPVVREDSHRLSSAPGDVVLVEFLDFECEACRAVYPLVEQLRDEYGDRVSFVARYFPLPGHANAMNAAIAVEAAAQQDAFEDMYHLMFVTQPEWGERQDSQAHVFRMFAQELDLDLDAYDQAVADPATRERVEIDLNDGQALGVTGTPTFFLNDERLQPRDADEFRAAIEAAIDD